MEFRDKPYITAQLPAIKTNYKLVRALTMTVDVKKNIQIVDIEKFIGEIFTGFKVIKLTKPETRVHIREWAGMSSALVVDGTRTIMASQMYDASFNPNDYKGVATYSQYYSKREKIGGSRITWLGAPAIVYTYKNRARLSRFLNDSLVLNLMFWITSFSSAKCFDDYGEAVEKQLPGYLRTELLQKIETYKDQAIRDTDNAKTKYIFAFDIDDTLCKQAKEEGEEGEKGEKGEKTKKKTKKKKDLSIEQTESDFIKEIIAKMKKIIQSENYVWIITANNYPKYQFFDIYFVDPQVIEFFSKSEYFYYMNNTNISLIYEDAKKFFPDDKLLDKKLIIDTVHKLGLKPHALYAQSLIEKYNYNTRHPRSKIGSFHIYLFDDNDASTLKENCNKFNIEFKHVTDFTENVPVLLGYLNKILSEEKFISPKQTPKQTPEQIPRDEIQTKAVDLYCNRHEKLQQFCMKPEFQKSNTYKNYYENPNQTKDQGEFLTSLDESIARIREEDYNLKKFNNEHNTDYYQRYNEMFSYVYPWDIEGIEVGAVDKETLQAVVSRITKERQNVKTELEKIIDEDNLKDSFKRINMIIYIIINNPDYANIIYDYINNKKGLKITYTLFLLTKLILLSKCNIDDIFTNKKFEFSLSADEETIKNLVKEIIKIMEEPLEFYEYTFDEKGGFEMKRILSVTIKGEEETSKPYNMRNKDLMLFREDDKKVREKFKNILCAKKSEIQLNNKTTSYRPYSVRNILTSLKPSDVRNILTSIKESRKPMKMITLQQPLACGNKTRYRRNKSRRNKSRRNKSRRNKPRRNKSRRKHKKKLISFKKV